MGVSILGSGVSLPTTLVSTLEKETELGLPEGSLQGKTGVHTRFYCNQESQIDLAVNAVTAALESAQKHSNEIDLIISGCGVPFQTLPSTAPLIQKRLHIPDGAARAFDVNSTCLSFLSGFDYASLMLKARRAKNVLVFSSEVSSRALPWKTDPETAAIFGDGAAAMVLSNSPDLQDPTFRMETYPSAYEACEISAGGTRFDFHSERDDFIRGSYFKMDGKSLFKITARHFKGFIDRVLGEAGWKFDEIDMVIPHQASPHGIEHLIKLSGFQSNKVINICASYGNQIAASIPTAYEIGRSTGQITPGQKLLFLGTSAGVSFGGLALQT